MGELQERITSTKHGSITSVQAIYVPADDYTDPAPATAFAHLDATTNLSRDFAAMGIYLAVAEPGVEIDLQRAQRALEKSSQELVNPSEGVDPASALAAVMRAEARIEGARKAQANEE